MQIVKVKFLKDGEPQGAAYTYYSKEVLKVGDLVKVNEQAKGIIVEVDTPEEAIADFKSRVKVLYGKVDAE